MTDLTSLRSDPKFLDAVSAVSNKLDADIISYSSNLFPPADARLIKLVQDRQHKRKNVLVALTTPGGLADVAYRIGRSIQHHYRTRDQDVDKRGKFYLYVPRWCKSAGTILALGADVLIMSEQAELGPIDAQLRKEDEVGDWTSGLTAIEALTTLQEKAASLFLKQFREMRFAPETRFSTRMATEIATRITTGLLEPIYAQIDPMRLGEIERFVRIAVDYGDRLAGDNVYDGTVVRLVVGYPSHGFIIDRLEAQELFRRVEPPSVELEKIGQIAQLEAHKAGVMSDEKAKPVLRFENEEVGIAEKKPERKQPRVGRRASGKREAKAKREVIPTTRATNASTVAPKRNGT